MMPRRPILALTLPEGLLATAGVAAALWPGMVDPGAEWLAYFRTGVLGVATLLAWRFDRGRVFLAIVAVAATDRAYALMLEPGTLPVLALSAPPVLAAIAAGDERGVLSWRMAVRLGVIVAIASVAAESIRRLSDIPGWLAYQMLPPTWTPLPAIDLLVIVAAAAFLVVRFLLKPTSVHRGLFWTLFALVAALHFAPDSAQSGLMFGMAGLVLVVSMVEDAYALAYRDELTGLQSRRSLEGALKRLGKHYTVAMVDVDRFKSLNDAYGHDIGDQVLRLVAARLRRTGGGGRIYRYGGEEFAMLFPGKLMVEVLPHLEAARATVEAAEFKIRAPGRPKRRPKRLMTRTSPQTLAVTVSIGAAEADGNNAKPSQVIKIADDALYRAKKKGRNRVEA
jgi:diguanylate cyclase (GGDEF)-like protein